MSVSTGGDFLSQHIGIFTGARQLAPRDGKRPLVSLSLEGHSFLYDAASPLPPSGAYIRIFATTSWGRGDHKRPVFWCQSWQLEYASGPAAVSPAYVQPAASPLPYVSDDGFVTAAE